MSKFSNLTKEELLALVQKQEAELASKKYGLVWDAEREPEQVVLDCEHHLPVLKRVEGKEIKTALDQGDNILIEGDNYHALTTLNYTHQGKIDVIYIDPPYNTGENDFKYNDKIVEKEDSFRHSKWLNFMEKRLKMSKEILSEDGVILISIDNHEFAQLKLLLDSKILSEDNFLGVLTWINKTKPVNSGKAKYQIQQNLEYVVCYSKKSKDTHPGFILNIEGERKYKYLDEKGPFRLVDIEDSDKGRKKRDTMKFSILGINPGLGKRWKIGEKEAKKLENENRLVIENDKIKKKIYALEESLGIQKPFWSHITDIGTAENGKALLTDIIGPDHGFDTVKPLDLITSLLEHFKEDVLILDFFAGSGTTGHAVLDLNKEDGGNRRFILCTNNENNICEDVTYPRLQKVIKGYKKNGDGEKVDGLGGNLQYFKTDLIKKTGNKDQMRINLTQKCTDMLCVKENIFNLETEHDDYKIFSSNQKDQFLCVYYNFYDESFDEFLKQVKKLKGHKKIYMFSIDGRVDKKLFVGINDFVLEEIPQKIIDIYKQIVKMNIPVKAETIFLDFEKAHKKIFEDKEKDEGARVLRIVLEKTLQKVAQKNGIPILDDKGKEQKIALLNDQLKDVKIISKIVWEENKTYLAIGNHASHGDYDEYDLKQVENFYKHIQELHNIFGI